MNPILNIFTKGNCINFLIIFFILSLRGAIVVLYDNSDKSYSIFKILLTMITIFFTEVGVYLFIYGEKVRDVERLNTVGSMISTFIGFMSAYTLFEFENKKEKKDKEKKEEEEKKYALDMLYSLLSFTIKQQHELWQVYALLIVQEYEKRYGIDKINTLFKYNTLYEMLTEYDLGQDAEILRKVITDVEFRDKEDNEGLFNVRKSFSELIYDKKWTEYLYYINKEDREYIVKWFNYLEEKKTRMSVILIIEYREKVIQILQNLGFDEIEEESLEVLIQLMIESDAYKELEINKEILG